MFGFHIWELLIILGIVLLIFGARRLPELGSAVGQTVQMFKKNANGPTEQVVDQDKSVPQIPEKTTSSEQ
jgi:sec-independent protein translocase protein TatA